MELRAQDVASVDLVSLQRDDYIAAAVDIEPASHPLMIVTWGSDSDGWVEIVAARDEGNIQRITVLTPPTAADPGVRTGDEVVGKLPTLNVAELASASTRSAGEDLALTLAGALRAGWRGGDWVLRFSEFPVAVRYLTHGLEVGCASDALLAEIVLEEDLLASATPFS
ncbi:hypothetical protein GCM10023200_17310 [Actinomycetospora chlora]|uniref:Uncharacterized protein n=1 Tax=Actinomycetospora chlora TaxID=663608 RepID=A0ABP9AR11_9PSEU